MSRQSTSITQLTFSNRKSIWTLCHNFIIGFDSIYIEQNTWASFPLIRKCLRFENSHQKSKRIRILYICVDICNWSHLLLLSSVQFTEWVCVAEFSIYAFHAIRFGDITVQPYKRISPWTCYDWQNRRCIASFVWKTARQSLWNPVVLLLLLFKLSVLLAIFNTCNQIQVFRQAFSIKFSFLWTNIGFCWK